MKMIPGNGTILDYGSYINNCTKDQLPYKVPINGLSDVQLFIDIGTVKPTTILYELIHTCGPNAGTVETLVTSDYVVGQNENDRWYGVFKNLIGSESSGVGLNCFVVAITLDANIFFSDEYCIGDCDFAVPIQGCYGNLASGISTDCNGIYFGIHAGTGTPMGNTSVAYRHKVFLRGVEVTTNAMRNTFKQGRTRTFRTEGEKIFQLWSEIVPEWYMEQINGVFFRGEVSINGTRYLLNETLFEKVDECLKQWSPAATFKESCYQSFSCETDPCADPPETCCDPVVINATVDTVSNESEGSGFPPAPSVDVPVIVIQGNVGGTIDVTGTSDPVTGIANGSSVVTCLGFYNKRVLVMRGGLIIPGIDPGGGGSYYTKNDTDTFITFFYPLVTDEAIYIETIP